METAMTLLKKAQLLGMVMGVLLTAQSAYAEKLNKCLSG